MTRKKEQAHALTIFEKMNHHKQPYTIVILEKCIPVLPDVFSPKYVSDVKWFAREVPKIVGTRSFLEIGTGTGVIALFVALHGAKNIVATDINPIAVKNARQTFRLHGFQIPVCGGNVFAPIRHGEKFDVIFWNHPFHFSEEKPMTMLDCGGYDYQYKSLKAFFAGAKQHLNAGGEVLLGTSKNARLDLIKAFGREYGYVCKLVKQETIPSEHRSGIKIDVRIYSFRTQKS